MPDAASDSRAMNRRVDELGDQLRRSTALHGLYAAVGLLVGLALPLAEIRFNQDEVPERNTALGLVFPLNSDYDVEHSTLVVISAGTLTITTLTAMVASLVAALRQDRKAATVALSACALLPIFLIMANVVFGVTDIDSGSDDDPLEGWSIGCWVLLPVGLAGCWIAAYLRDQFDR